MRTDTENDTRHPGQRSGTVQSPYIQNEDRYRRMTPGIRDRRSGDCAESIHTE
ncbi:unnamed protein product [Staurois parvus]|uniref:Uncharacterized protein n=1 Tax=Staurois parvus TaxID=386267 RepID=A0ABN9AAL1_9NEOB|nr:unnamed protein product [Staurois parvus]